MLGMFVGFFIDFKIKSKVMIASDDNFMLVRKSFQKLSKPG